MTPLFRLVQAEQKRSSRCFCPPVFAEQGMYLALFELKGNIIIGNYARKALCYMRSISIAYASFQTQISLSFMKIFTLLYICNY